MALCVVAVPAITKSGVIASMSPQLLPDSPIVHQLFLANVHYSDFSELINKRINNFILASEGILDNSFVSWYRLRQKRMRKKHVENKYCHFL